MSPNNDNRSELKPGEKLKLNNQYYTQDDPKLNSKNLKNFDKTNEELVFGEYGK